MHDFSLRVRLLIRFFRRGKLRKEIELDMQTGRVRLGLLHASCLKRVLVRAMALAFALIPTQQTFLRSAQEISYSSAGSPRTVILQDGSTVVLNEYAVIEVRFTPVVREIVLSKGEALFSVAHNTQWPLRVVADNTTVQAIGTAFSVRKVDFAATDVLVTQGRVLVSSETHGAGIASDPSHSLMVDAGHGLEIRDQVISELNFAADELKRRLRWVGGLPGDKPRELADVVYEFNKFNEIKLVIDDASIAHTLMMGGLTPTDLEGFVKGLTPIYKIGTTPPTRLSTGERVIRLRKAKERPKHH